MLTAAHLKEEGPVLHVNMVTVDLDEAAELHALYLFRTTVSSGELTVLLDRLRGAHGLALFGTDMDVSLRRVVSEPSCT